jgi:signal transduction histidine kinase
VATCGAANQPDEADSVEPISKTFEQDIAAIGSIKAIPTILDIVCRTTGMRFAAVARVTEDRWIACSVRDDINFGLKAGGELKVETTICHEIRQSGKAVVIDHVSEDANYACHHTPQIYSLQSYIAMPIRLTDGSFFGTLCAIDPEPHRLKTPETIQMFEMFADVIGFQLSAANRMDLAEAHLLDEQNASSLREQFIAVLGHDLRNPLASISGGARLLRKETLSERGTQILGMMHGSIVRMSGLIDNVLDFARGRLGGGFTLTRKADVALQPILEQVINELRVGAPGRAIETNFTLPERVNCDPSRFGQMVSNLLGNALVYGAPDEPVRIHAATKGDELELWVANAGKPIPPAAMERLFQPFFRAEVRPSQQGLGLGLHIASEIAKAHGGAIEVASTPQETRFTFRMPLSA